MELPELGTTFQNKYRVDKVLGEGGFARVYEAEDIGARRIVALKVLKPTEDGYARATESRFNREVKLIAMLSDPHTITMFDFGRTEEGLLFMVFEYVPGLDLSELLEARGPLGDEATIHILRQVLMSLREAHYHGLLHRDLKPANIRVYEYMGDPLRVTLLDFGIAKPVKPSEEESAITHSGSLVGTPQYMSPEQLLEQQLTPASDIYSLGLVAYEMLTGTTAIKGNSLSDQLHILAGASGLSLPPEARVSPGLRRIVDRMISRDANMRLQTAEQVLRSLEALVRGEPTGDISMEEFAALRPRTGSQPLQPAPGVYPQTGSSSGEMARPPSGSGHGPQPTTERGAAIPMRPASGETQPATGELSTPVLAGALAVVLGCVAVVLYAGWGILQGTSDPEPSKPVKIPRALGIVKEDTPRPPHKAEPEPAANPDLGVAKPADGCGVGTFFGERGLDYRDGVDKGSIRTYIPKSYDPRERHPVLVVFHDLLQDSSAALKRLDLAKFAEENQIIIALPDSKSPPWEGREVEQVAAALDFLSTQFCIDRSRIFGMGHGVGGRAAVKMPCVVEGVAGIATTSFRPEPGPEMSLLCRPNPPVPYIHFAALKDSGSPVDGGRRCGRSVAQSVDDYEKAYRKISGCDGAAKSWNKYSGGTCTQWACESAPFVSCRVNGGREWAGKPRQFSEMDELIITASCDGPPARFPYQKAIWDFFSEQASK